MIKTGLSRGLFKLGSNVSRPVGNAAGRVYLVQVKLDAFLEADHDISLGIGCASFYCCTVCIYFGRRINLLSKHMFSLWVKLLGVIYSSWVGNAPLGLHNIAFSLGGVCSLISLAPPSFSFFRPCYPLLLHCPFSLLKGPSPCSQGRYQLRPFCFGLHYGILEFLAKPL